MLSGLIKLIPNMCSDDLQFLSMKLATVNPELNFDIDRILPKEVSLKIIAVVIHISFTMKLKISMPYY